MANIHSLFSGPSKKKGGGNTPPRRPGGEPARLNVDRDGPSSDEEHSEDDEGRQGFYVGGSERSGQEVLGPPRADRDVAGRLFDAARQHGAEQITPEEAEQATHRGGGASSRQFQGSAYRLGGHGQESEQIVNPQARPPARERVVVTFNVWTNGFSLDEGPLRTFEDPQNRAFLDSIRAGQIPAELTALHPSRQIDFHMVRKEGEYVPPKKKPFAGEGVRLGAVVPAVVGEGSSNASTGSGPTAVSSSDEHKQSSAEEAEKLLKEALASVNVQEGEPQTRVQIRLAGSSNIVGVFNHTHTLNDLRSFIVAARPELAFRPFQLMTSYPPKVIEEESASLKDAGLLNSVVLVKFL